MADYSQLDDRELLELMLVSDEDAFIALYRRRQAGLYRFALRMTGSHAAAEDAVQESFLVLMRRAPNYDPARGSVSAFLYGIARNCVLRGLERSGSLVAMDAEQVEERAERQATAGSLGGNHATNPTTKFMDDPSREQEVEQLRRAILALPEHYRTAVVLCDLEELSYREAAAALDCAVGTVRSRLHRGRALLGERLKSLSADYTDSKDRPQKKMIKPVECEV